MIKVTLEFKSVEEVISALAKIMDGAPLAVPATARGITGEPPAAPSAPSAKRTRKPRADAGKPRGEYKPREEPKVGAPAEPITPPGPQVQSQHTVPESRSEAPLQESPPASSTPVPVAPSIASAPTPNTEPAPAPVAPGAPVPPEVQSAVERLYAAKGPQILRETLQRFGVTRARDLDGRLRSEFVVLAENVINAKA